MIRPPLFSEVACRHNTRLNSYGRWLDGMFCRYRWSEAVLDLSEWSDDSAAALQEFFPDAAVVTLRKMDRLFPNEHLNHFNVVLCAVSAPHRQQTVLQLKRILRLGGLLVVEGAVDAGCRVDDFNGSHIYWYLNLGDGL